MRQSVYALVAGVLLALGSPAYAGSIGLMAAGGEDPVSGLTAPRTLQTGSTHKFITADFADNAADRCMLWHFAVPPDFPGTDVKWYLDLYQADAPGGAAAGNFRVDWVQVSSGNPYASAAFNTGTTVGGVLLGSTQGTMSVMSCLTAGCVVGETAFGGGSEAAVKLCRVGADPYTGNISVIGLTLQY